MVFQAKARSYNQQTLVVGCISNKKSMKKTPAGICPMRPSRPGVDFYKLILHFFYVLNGLINITSLDIRSICQVIPQMIFGWPFRSILGRNSINRTPPDGTPDVTFFDFSTTSVLLSFFAQIFIEME